MIDLKECLAFKPKFDEVRYKELMVNTPTNFPTPKGNVNERKEFVRSILASARLLWQELDRNNLYFGNEGSGKSHTVFQHTYIWWWVLNELGMINYPFGMHLIFARLPKLIDAMNEYKDVPFMIYSLDESDDLNRKNWNKPIVKEFMSKLRKERKNLRVMNLLMPALEEMLPGITLSRINWIIQLDMTLDSDFNLKRGKYKLMVIPVADKYYSVFNKRYIYQKEIKAYINNRLYNNDLKFEELPLKLIAFTGRTNKTFMFDKAYYKEWARKENAEALEENKEDKHLLQRDTLIQHLLTNKVLKQQEIANIIGVSRTTIGSIKAKRTTA